MLYGKDGDVEVRSFFFEDIPNKVKWINDRENNTYLHYDLPLEQEKTEKWFMANNDRTDRIDAVIEYEGVPVGLIGLLSIDPVNKKSEYYVCMGESKYKGRNIATKASNIIINHGFLKCGLNKIYLYTEKDNILAQKLFEKLGFKNEGLMREDLIYCNRKVDRYAYGLLRDEWEREI